MFRGLEGILPAVGTLKGMMAGSLKGIMAGSWILFQGMFHKLSPRIKLHVLP